MKKSKVAALLLCLLAFCACRGPKDETKEQALPPMVRVNGRTYKDTGYVNAMVTSGSADGQITSRVKNQEDLTRDDQANFGKGYDYQTWKEGYINVKIDGQWILFQDLTMDTDQPPEGVANFTGKVHQVEDDTILVETIQVDQAFAFKDLLKKPIEVPLAQVVGGSKLEDLEGKNLRVWFDGQVKNRELESSAPIRLGEVYRIQVLNQ